MTPARLHVVTDDDVLARPGFVEIAAALGRTHGGDLALHLRGHGTPARRLHALALSLEAALENTEAGLLIADRIDVALATRNAGVVLGAQSIPVVAGRTLLGGRPLGRSVHAVAEAVEASADGANFLVVGTIWPTGSHPGRPGAGAALLREVAGRVPVPIVAIGGVTPARASEARRAGAAGVAVLTGVWGADDPVRAAAEYLEEG